MIPRVCTLFYSVLPWEGILMEKFERSKHVWLEKLLNLFWGKPSQMKHAFPEGLEPC